ncbi:MAG: tyrosyl-tRNA synthetase [Parcubacteria group bacterium Gr01-1014_73]|nr:MAG: tyrosyl-tRNA synthetase [Parcubacteria group bacterium Gr01-1014_73]
MLMVDHKLIEEALTCGVEEVFVLESLRRKLLSGKELRVKHGIDPTGAQIHIGRAAVLWKLRAFQELGHKIILIIGDFTAQIGDPSDKLAKRPMLSKEQIQENFKDYKNQIGKILDLTKIEFVYNGDWLGKLGFQEISELAEGFSVQQMSARRNFQERFDKNEEVSLREFLYPLMQGYDSVVVKADVEIGGTDQLFNLKAGRVIQKHYGQPEQDIMTLKMLAGTDGRKMSTSWGNVINITDEPDDMFGKVMSVRDDLILDYFLLCTNTPSVEIEEVKSEMAAGKNPRDIKLDLAEKIVARYHGEKEAKAARESFISVFKAGNLPENIKETKAEMGELLVVIVLRENLVSSKSEFRRLVSEGAVSNAETKEKITDPFFKITSNLTIRIGPLRFLKIKI